MEPKNKFRIQTNIIFLLMLLILFSSISVSQVLDYSQYVDPYSTVDLILSLDQTGNNLTADHFKGNLIGGTGNFTHLNSSKGLIVIGDANITDRLFVSNLEIEMGNVGSFIGLDKAVVIDNLILHEEGSVAFAFVDESDNKILRTYQVGIPDGAGFNRNSQIISGDFGITNATQLSRCTPMAEQMGIDMDGIGCNTSSLGASLLVEGSIRLGHRLAIGGGNKSSYGIISQGFADFNMEGSNFNIFNGSLHIFAPRREEIGVATGESVRLLDEDFEDDSISPFQKREQVGADGDNWDIDMDPDFCFDGICAKAKGGNGRHPRLMEHNLSTANFEALNISFWIGARNIDTTDNLSVVIIDGSNTVMVYNFTGTSAASNLLISPPELITALIPSSFDDKSKISIRFNISADRGGTGTAREEFWVDNVILRGKASTSTRANVTRRDSVILLGDGGPRIFWNDSSKVLELPPNSSFIAESVQDLFVSGSLTLGSDRISKFGDLGFIVNNSDANLTNLRVKEAPPECSADSFMTYTNMSTSICVTPKNDSNWNQSGNDIFNRDFGGNVGVGAATPNSPLDVNGRINVLKDDEGGINFRPEGDARIYSREDFDQLRL